ncbi:chaperone binding protein [Plasmodium gonderi]|uniref:Chaperone binding protein n=1 Tax=Plasmodium gonderi TaxID=77519 RepID=A0A1Y1JI88_PLAGO|nr:chaperone binding protein [Plasmodium gonderi]GAW82226.1 chaperone binding protein [Plasmodium gonderi]
MSDKGKEGKKKNHTNKGEKKDSTEDEKDKEFEEKIKNLSFDERVKSALNLKLEGNNDFKKKNYEEAISKYKEGLKYINKLENKNDKIVELEIAFHQNMSICYSNVENYNDAYEHVKKVLHLDKDNAKGMFRLCQIEYNRSNLDIAKEKIQEFIKCYPDNMDAKKLLKNIVIKQNEHNKKQKQAFSKIFEKASGLYEDREKEILRKKKEKYESYMKSCAEKNEKIVDFDEWEIMENEKREKENEEQKQKQKEKQAEKETEKRKQKDKEKKKKKSESITSNTTNNSSCIDIDEEDQKIIDETKKMGYCYFKKDIKEDDKKLFEKNIPIKIENGVSDDYNLCSNENKAISSWNAAGTTYEEKDMTKWAKQKLEECLKNIHFKNTEKSDFLNLNNQNEYNLLNADYPEVLPIQYLYKIDLNDIKDLTVDAQVVVIRGTKRHIFELSCSLYVTLNINITELHIHKVIVEITELSSELEAGKTWRNYITVKKNDKLKVPDKLFNSIYEFLIEKVENQVRYFTEEYKKM